MDTDAEQCTGQSRRGATGTLTSGITEGEGLTAPAVRVNGGSKRQVMPAATAASALEAQ